MPILRRRWIPQPVSRFMLTGCVLLYTSTLLATSVTVDLVSDASALRVDSDRQGDCLGCGVAACDFNRDGLIDVALGADGGDGPAESRPVAGEISIVWGARGRKAGVADITAIRAVYVIGQDAFDELGARLACGDVNGDGVPDLIGGGPLADGPTNTLNEAGQAHIIFGSVPWPAVRDLAIDPGTIIYGRAVTEHFGVDFAVGDINGDGTKDVLANAPDGLNKNNNFVAGRVYGFFGRASWPATIDLATTSANLTIFGRTNTSFGTDLTVGDLDGDGTGDLVAAARLGDTPVSGRVDAGDVYIFRGRTSWPTTIDLNTQSATTRAYGVDTLDYAGDFDGLAIGDIDSSGVADLAIGLRGADGRANTQSLVGEVRIIAPGLAWPSTIDLATNTRQIIYGQRDSDVLGTDEFTGDVNGDGTQDLIVSAPNYDGNDGTQTNAGAVIVILGRPGFPVDTDMATGGEDWRILGAPGYRLHVHGVADINADGIDEIVVANEGIDAGANSVWFVSPIDVDGDGVQQLADNCPLVANANQLDTDGDSIGDVCQFDYDGDGANDPQDCAPSNRKLGKPGDIKGVQLVGNASTTMTWQPNTAADTYSVLRGLVSELSNTNYGSCQDARDSNTADTSFVEGQAPPAGDSFFFLVLGRDAGCGGRGSLGSTSAGAPRVNQNPADCP